jgi:hypothetical protein
MFSQWRRVCSQVYDSREQKQICWCPMIVDARICISMTLELSNIQFVIPCACHMINSFISGSLILSWKMSLYSWLRIIAKRKLNKISNLYSIRKLSYYSFTRRTISLFLLCYIIWQPFITLNNKLRATRQCEWSNKKRKAIQVLETRSSRRFLLSNSSPLTSNPLHQSFVITLTSAMLETNFHFLGGFHSILWKRISKISTEWHSFSHSHSSSSSFFSCPILK